MPISVFHASHFWPRAGEAWTEKRRRRRSPGGGCQIWQTSFFDRSQCYRCHLNGLNKRVGGRLLSVCPPISTLTQHCQIEVSVRVLFMHSRHATAFRCGAVRIAGVKQKFDKLCRHNQLFAPRAQQTMRLRSTQDNFRRRAERQLVVMKERNL